MQHERTLLDLAESEIFMRQHRKQFLIAGLTVALLAVLCACWLIQQEEPEFPVSICVFSGASQKAILSWAADEGNQHYLFLPSYAELDTAQILLHTEEKVTLDGATLQDGMTCEDIRLNVPYEVKSSCWGGEKTWQLTFIQSANVSAMYIDTESGSMDYIHHEKRNAEAGSLLLYTKNGTVDYRGKITEIYGRGNATWNRSKKKPYNVTLAQEADLLGMGAAQNWVLLANAYDPSHIRNKLVYDFAADAGLPYSPDSQWVDLYLNGEYAGLYQLCEKNEIHAQRVNISPEDGWLVSMELEERLIDQNLPYVVTKEQQALRLRSPQTKDAADEILSAFQSVENAILAEEGIDPETGRHWQDLIDLDSWARVYLLEEIFASNDGCFMSQFFYYDGRTGRIHAGPVWDFDVSLGNPENWQFTNPEALYANRAKVRATNSTPWFNRLYQNEVFYECVVEQYKTEFLPLVKEITHGKLSTYCTQIKQAASMDSQRWKVDRSMETEIEEIEKFLTQRLSFLSEVWIDGEKKYQIQADQGNNSYYAHYFISPGACLTTLPVLESTTTQTFLGWYHADTNEPFNPEEPITSDLELYAKWEETSSNKIKQLLKLTPLAAIAVLGVAFLVADIRRNPKGR